MERGSRGGSAGWQKAVNLASAQAVLSAIWVDPAKGARNNPRPLRTAAYRSGLLRSILMDETVPVAFRLRRGMEAMRKCLWLLAVSGLIGLVGCRSPYAQDRLALAGAGIGGVTGAIVGNQLGSTAGGAIVGAAAGTIAGSLTGQAIDESEARAAAQPRYVPPPPGAVSVGDIVEMRRQGLEDGVIIGQIQNRGMAHPVSTDDLIALQQAGVSPDVQQAAQNAPGPPPTVIVEHAPPYYYYGPRRYYYHPRPRVGVGVHF